MLQIQNNKINTLPYSNLLDNTDIQTDFKKLMRSQMIKQKLNFSNKIWAKNEIDVEAKQKARLERVMKLSGIGSSKTGDVSQRVDEILAEGINKREGWSLP